MIEAGRNAVNSQRYTPESKDEAVREVLQRKSHDAASSNQEDVAENMA